MKRKFILIIGGIIVACAIVASVTILLVKSYAPELSPLSCSQAVPVEQAQQIWDENQPTVQAVRAISDSAGQVTISLDTTRCAGRAFLNIVFDTSNGRRKVRQVLEQSPLKALPVEWHNA
jgi:hypothetical protein